MKTKKIIFLIFILIAVGLTSAILSSDNNLTSSLSSFQEPPKLDDSILRIVQATPVNSISLSDKKKEVFVVFNHPMVPLAQLEGTTKGVFSISPSVKGKYRWYGSRICSFMPEKGWYPGRKYNVKIKKGLKSLNNKRLPKTYTFSFKIKVPHLRVSISTRPYRYNTIDYDQNFVLNFNLPVRLKDVYKRLKIKNRGRNFSYKLSYYKGSNSYNRYSKYSHLSNNRTSKKKNLKKIRVKIIGKFYPDSEVEIYINKRLSSSVITTSLKRSKNSTYKTHGPLNISLSTSPNYYQSMSGYYFKFNNNVNLKRASRSIVFTPPVKLSRNISGKGKYLYISLWDCRAGKKYKVTIAPFKDIYGNRLSGNRKFNIDVPNYRPGFSVEERLNTIESKMNQTLPVNVINLREIDVRVGNFDFNNLQQKLFIGYKYSIIDHIETDDTLWDTGVGLNQAYLTGFKLNKYLTKNHRGWVAVEFSAQVPGYYDDKPRTVSIKQIVQSTDLGITVKESYKSSHIWVHSLSYGNQIKGATVKLYDDSNIIGTCKTDENGYCKINQNGMLKKSIYIAEKDGDKAFITSRDHDVSMYSLNSNYDSNSSKKKYKGKIFFDRKLYRPGDKVSFKGIITVREKGKLRPLRRKKIQVEISRSYGDNVYLKKYIVTSNEGGIWGSYNIPKGAPLGHYRISIYPKSSKSYYNRINDTFQVEEFRPVSFSVDLDGPRDSHIGDNLDLTINGMYLFGAPMQNAPVSYSLTRSKSNIHFDRFSSYIFGDNEFWYNDSEDYSDSGYYSGGSGKLNSGGKFKFKLNLKPMFTKEETKKPKRTYKISNIYNMRMEATVKDVDDKSVTKTASFRVFPGKFLIGIKPINRYQNYKKKFKFDLIAVSNDGKNRYNKKVEVRIIKKTWKSILTKGPGGSTQTKNTLVTELILKKNLTLSSRAKRFEFKIKKSGDYTITVQEKNGYSFSRDSFYAFGGKMTAWDFKDDDTIILSADKKSYNPGDKAKVLIKSPFKKCKAIITLERESIIWQKSILLTEKSGPIVIPIKKNYLPNVYFSVMLIRPRVKIPKHLSGIDRKNFIKNDLGIPKFKVGIIKVPVNIKSKTAILDIKTDKDNYSPGEMITIKIKSDPKSEIVLSVADRGVLDLIGYSYKNPNNYFYNNWALGVRIFENRRLLIKQHKFLNKGNSPGGSGEGEEDGGIGGFGLDSEDGARKDIRYTAFWKPDIITDSSGNAVIKFKLPHNLTTFRILALTASNGKYNVVNKEFRVRKAMVIQKNLPRFIRPGDKLNMGAVIINQTGMKGKFKASIQSSLLKIKTRSKIVTINPGEAKEVSFPVEVNFKKYSKAKRVTKSNTLEVDATGWLSVKPINLKRFSKRGFLKKDVVDRLKFNFPIRELPLSEAFSIAHYSENKTKEYIKIPDRKKIIPELGGMNITLSTTSLIGLNKAFSFFKSSPYFCLEQRASAFLLTMTAGSLLQSFSIKPPDKNGYDFTKIEKLFLSKLKDFQNSDGGFRAWKNSARKKSSPYLTAYTVLVMRIAKNYNYDINQSIMNKAVKYLKKYIEKPDKEGIKFVLETLSLINYIFQLEGEDNTMLTALLLKNEKTLSLRAKGYLALTVAENKNINYYKDNSDTNRLVSYLLNRMQVTTRKVTFDEPLSGSHMKAYYSGGSTLGIALKTLITLDHKNPLIPKIVNYMISHKSHLWVDTHSSGIMAMALKDYYNEYEKSGVTKDSNALVIINGNSIVNEKFEKNKLKLYTFNYQMDKVLNLGMANKIYPMVFKRTGSKGRLYYTATLNYAPVLEVVKPRDEGIEIRNVIYDLSKASKNKKYGVVIKDNLKRGEIYLCRITLVAPKPYFNAVIVAPIPSNVEIVNSSFQTEKSSMDRYTTNNRNSYGYYSWYYSSPITEYRDDKVVITEEYLYSGMHDYFYLIRPTLRGRSTIPAASAKLMYEPEIFGRTANATLKVR